MRATDPRYLLAVDIGGTFTDIVLLNRARPALIASKVLTTHPDPSEGVLCGVKALFAAENVPDRSIERVIHGTTLVTNALIERSGARTALLTTEGFRDALEIGNEGRYDIYDLGLVKPAPLVERRLRFGIPERMDARGSVAHTLDRAALQDVCDLLDREGVEAVAVCYLHAYANPKHELETADTLRSRLPGVPVSLSHQVSPTMREYQRTSTTVANAYVQPLTGRYLERLEAGLHDASVEAPLNTMLSNGGTCTVKTAAAFPIRLAESGPCGGALAGAHWGKASGFDEVLAFDMGGTTAKAAMTEKGEFAIVTESEVAHVHRFKRGSGLPLQVPMLHMIEIGAGGGSIARYGSLGLPVVGPESANSNPGPACYQLGGEEPTVTDSDLLLGYLNPDDFAQGTMTLDAGAAQTAYAPLAAALNLPLKRAAWGVHQLVNENMAAATRVHAAERGLDLRSYAMVATGGAGPVHACGAAHRMGVHTVIIPPLAGVASAFGLLLAPTAFDFTRSYLARLTDIDHAQLNTMLAELEEEGRVIVLAAGVSETDISVTRTVDMRYVGQGYEVRVHVAEGPIETAQLKEIQQDFERGYADFYGCACEGVPIEAVHWRVVIAGPGLEVGALDAQQQEGNQSAHRGTRPALFDTTQGYVETPVFRRAALGPGFACDGPAIIEEAESTTVVLPGWRVQYSANACLIMEPVK